MLKVFKCSEKAIIPSYSTEASACFDVHACIESGKTIKIFSETNTQLECGIMGDFITIPAKCRALIPTGCKFDIPQGHSVRLHPRSGLALKNGIMLANCEGVVDEDYIHEVFIAVYNVSSESFQIKHGDRIAQAELIQDVRTSICEVSEAPQVKTDRIGGFGSTGV